ncbi:MAG TPA: hypothetical protein VFB86_02375 [Bacteroidales bacterium]|nr:hypothetical protein [Bacteroidales bacterium]
MTIDNGQKIVAIRLIGFIATVIYVLYVFMAYFPKIFQNIMSENNVHIMTAAITVIYLLLILYPVIMKFRYIYFSADERGITLRWYKTGLIPGDSKSVEIPALQFAGYEITTGMMGMHHYLTLYQRVQGQKAAYSPVSITALSASQRAKIEEVLKTYKSAG